MTPQNVWCIEHTEFYQDRSLVLSYLCTDRLYDYVINKKCSNILETQLFI